MTEKIRLDGITKRFGNVVAVDDVDASFSEGAYTMILGPSGSGKSTMLRIIAGLERPTRGDVYVDGERVTDTRPQDRDLSMVFQNLALWDHKTVRENMAFGLRMAGVGREERNTRVTEIANLLRIEDKLDDSPETLSGGQQQRVALGRSLVRQPEVVLLDEPLASLDERLRLEMRTELKRIQQETETTFIHVTHNQEDSMTVADEILLLDEGKRQQFGDPLELYREPANEFVAKFIGSPSMNLFDATVVEDDGRVYLDANGVKLALVDGDFDVPDRTVRAGVRPDAVRIGDGTEPAASTFDARVSLVETFGDFNWYYLDCDVDDEFVVQSADDDVIDSVSQGDQVTVTVRPEALHVFDPREGDALN